jgi:hypothetical protein
MVRIAAWLSSARAACRRISRLAGKNTVLMMFVAPGESNDAATLRASAYPASVRCECVE